MATDTSADAGGFISIDGLQFPSTVKMAGSSQTLAGGGTRIKFGVVKVYAVGVYLDAAGSKTALKSYYGMESSVLLSKSGFVRAIVDGKFGKTLLMKFHRSVSSGTIADALRDSMAPRLSAAVLAKFRSMLATVLSASSDLPKGSELYFSCRGDTLHLASGTPKGAATLAEKTVCTALFDVYLGTAPVSPAAKEGFVQGFAERIAKM